MSKQLYSVCVCVWINFEDDLRRVIKCSFACDSLISPEESDPVELTGQ